MENKDKDSINKGKTEILNNQKSPISMSYELFILAVSILSIFNIFIVFLPIKSQCEDVILIIGALLSIIFISDFIYRLSNSKSKSHYFLKDQGWLDLLGSIPIPQARIFRLFRIFKASKTIRKFGFKNMMIEFQKNKAQSALYVVFFLIIMVLEFGGAFMIAVESRDPNANIKTGGDAIWWTFVTITTVGYGDRFPITPAGRMIGAMVMITGVGLFAVFTGFLANTFLAPRNIPEGTKSSKEEDIEKMKTQIEDLKSTLEKLEKEI